jgi:type IV secretory pathway VirB9-like protein
MSARVLASSSVVASALTLSAVATPWLSTVVTGQTPGIREVSASAHSVIPLQARLRFTTLIVLPEDDEILDVICGDKDFWVISATHNMAHVKPAKEGAATNLNLVTASGAVYSFLLNEKGGPSTPDLKVYVTADPDAPHVTPKYYTGAQFDRVQADLLEARNGVEAERRRATDAIASYQQAYPSTLQFVYGTPKYEKPFLVRAIWHDGQFTYVKTDATELPALYEVKDGTPALVNFQVRGGTYVVSKVIDRGYLALGKAQWSFAQQGR